MTIDELLKDARNIWGDNRMQLPHVAIAAEVIAGDLCRQARSHIENNHASEAEVKKELGNLIFSAIRWCDDLGYDPNECITLAKQAQTDYQSKKAT